MRGERDEVARRAVIEALNAGESVSAAARLGKVARRTVYQWRDRGDPEIEAALVRAAELRAAGPVATALAQALPVSAALSEDDRLALEALRAVTKDGESEACRVAAAKALLDHGHKMRIAAKAGPAAPAPAATPEAPAAEIGAEEAAARFRVVS